MSEHEQLRLLVERQSNQHQHVISVLERMEKHLHQMALIVQDILKANAATQVALYQVVTTLQANQDKDDADLATIQTGVQAILAALTAINNSPGTVSSADEASWNTANAATQATLAALKAVTDRSTATATALDALGNLAVVPPAAPAPAPAA